MGLTYSSVIDAGQDEVFSWHTRPGAVTRLLPPWQPVRVLHEAGSLRDGRATLTLPGGLRWVATHQPDAYDPPNSFADSLTSLPLPWRHTHQFSPAGDGATLMTDVIETPIPARALRSVLVYRHRQLAADLAALARARVISQDQLTVAVTGSSGLIGTALTALLTTSGHRVIPLVRRLPRIGERYWRPEDPAAELLDGVDAVIHLAGASIAGRFTPERKNEIRASRILPTRKLAELAAASHLSAFVTASAIGIYGPDRGEEVLTETSPREGSWTTVTPTARFSPIFSERAGSLATSPRISPSPWSPPYGPARPERRCATRPGTCSCSWLFGISLGSWRELPALVGPLLMSFILTRGTGARMTDRRMTASRPRYVDYVARTSGFIPLPPKRAPKRAPRRSAAAATPPERARGRFAPPASRTPRRSRSARAARPAR